MANLQHRCHEWHRQPLHVGHGGLEWGQAAEENRAESRTADLVREHRTGNKNQNSPSGRGRGLEWHGIDVELICGTLAEKVGPHCL